MKPWWEQEPERLDYELQALRDSNIQYEITKQDSLRGMLELTLTVPVADEQHRLTARYSPFFPYARIEIFAPDLQLSRHQNPFFKNLCLISRASDAWDIEDTAAALLVEQLPKVLFAAKEHSVDEVKGIEQQQGEPVSSYLSYLNNSNILVDSSWVINPTTTKGTMKLGIAEMSTSAVRAAVLEVQDVSGRVVANVDDCIREQYSHSTVRVRWYRLKEPILEQSPKEFMRRLSEMFPDARPTFYSQIGNSRADIIAALIPEEIEHRKWGNGWIFVLNIQRARAGFREGKYFESQYLRASRAGESDRAVRVPMLRSLTKAKIGVVGLGCIGAPSAVEFARSGVAELRLMDADIVEPATVARWPLGLTAAGKQKALALQEFLRQNYAYTRIKSIIGRFGAIPELGGLDLVQTSEFFDGLSLIYDATAEIGIHYLLSQIAREREMTYVCVSATPGGWGGRVLRIIPGRTKGCWACLLHAIKSKDIPEPHEDPAGVIRPVACTDPTFVGTNFDLLNIPLAGVRMSTMALCVDDPNGYPDIPYDVEILNLRDDKGEPTLPVWQGFELRRHPACANH